MVPPESHFPAARGPRQIAIDGPAGAGKSTAARRVAAALGFTYIDTGAMYRALAWAVQERRIPPDDAEAVAGLAQTLEIGLRPEPSGTRVLVDGQDVTDRLRSPELSNLTSLLSAQPAVREQMLVRQRRLGAAGDVVMEGRDIGTVVLPDAPVKVFLTASLRRRALRRQAELAERGLEAPLQSLLDDIAARDARDAGRAAAPLRAAPDAVVLNSDEMDAEQVAEQILQMHREATRGEAAPVA